MTRKRSDTRRARRAEEVERIAVALAAALESVVSADAPIYTDVITDAFERARHIISQRRDEAVRRDIEERFVRAAAWRKEQGLLSAYEYMEKYGLSKAQFAVAVDQGLLNGRPQPAGMYASGAQMSKWDRAYPDRPLTEDELRHVSDAMLLTANQAAEYLHITRAQFDRLKKKRGLQVADTRTGDSGYPYNLYRLADIEGLKEE